MGGGRVMLGMVVGVYDAGRFSSVLIFFYWYSLDCTHTQEALPQRRTDTTRKKLDVNTDCANHVDGAEAVLAISTTTGVCLGWRTRTQMLVKPEHREQAG